MPTNTPLPISGIVYDLDGSTSVGVGTRVIARNFTKGEEISEITIAGGEFLLDLANCITQWEANDIVYIYAISTSKHAVARLKIASGQGSWEVDLYMKSGSMFLGDCFINSVVATADGTARAYNFIERDTDVVLLNVNVAANSTFNVTFPIGKKFRGGYYIIKTTVGNTVADQGTGASNSTGDKTSNVDLTVAIDAEYKSFRS